MKNIISLMCLVVAALLIAPLQQAKAYIVLSYENPGDINILANDTLAQKFTLGQISYNLLTVSLDLTDVTEQTAGLLAVGVYNDASGTPGSLFSSLSYVSMVPDSVLNKSFDTVTFSGTGQLQANTSYWVKLDNSSNIGWISLYNPPVLGTATYGVRLLDQEYVSTRNNLGLTVTGTAVVPEPSTYALFGLGALGLVFACRRRVA